MESLWRVTLLGELRVERATAGEDGEAPATGRGEPAGVITRFPTRKTAGLLAYLAFHRAREQPRELVAGLLWPDSDLDAARNSLNVAVSSLRRLLEPRQGAHPIPPGAVLRADRRVVALAAGAIATDVAEFETALHRAGATEASAERGRWLEAAREAYRGPLLPGFYEEWIHPERRRLAELYFGALRQLTALRRQEGRLEEAIACAVAAVAADPLREEARRDLMRLYAEAGQLTAALREHHDLQQLLRHELGVAPSPETEALAASLRNAAPRSPPPNAGRPARPAGPIGLPYPLTRFIGREVETEQLLAMLAPRPREGNSRGSASEAGRTVPGAPESATAPVARARHQAAPRLVTLTGPGGCGKTRLALAVADQLRAEFNGSVWLVPLADVSDAEQLGEEIRQAIRLPQGGDGHSVEQVAAALQEGGGPALLILDNFEHLIAGQAGVASGSGWVRSLLEHAPRVTCLVTSRQRLGLSGEREFAVAPLPVPGEGCWRSAAGPGGPTATSPDDQLENLSRVASVQLFLDRAQAARADFQLTQANAAAVAQLCDWLEGLPLAIELAAARAGVLTPGEILAHLAANPGPTGAESRRLEFLVSRRHDLPPRHQTLRDTLAWSYRLLSPELQRFFAALSVFRGGWTLEAAEAVCGPGSAADGGGVSDGGRGPHQTSDRPAAASAAPRTLDALQQLRECSLILAEETAHGIRFRMLETLREFAAEQLGAEERVRLRQRHLHWYLGLAEQAERHLQGPEQARWLDLLETVYDNLRAALAWCVAAEAGDRSEAALRLGGALWGFWLTRGYLAEGREWLEQALAVAEGPLPGPQRRALRAKALIGAGNIAKYQGEYDRAASLYRQARAEAREAGDRMTEAYALSGLGLIAGDQGEAAAAGEYLQKALAAFRSLDHAQGTASTLNNLGNAACREADFATASALYEEGLAVLRKLGDRHGMAVTLNNLGLVARYRGELALARERHDEALALHRALGNQGGAAYSLNGLGLVAIDLADLPWARSVLEESLATFRRLGHQRGVAYALNNLGRVALADEDLALAQPLLDEALTLFRGVGEQEGVGHALNNLGAAIVQAGNPEGAQSFYRQSLALFQRLGNRRGIIHSLEGSARLLAAAGKPELSARLSGAAEAIQESVGIAASEPERAERNARRAALTQRLSRAGQESDAWAEGRELSSEEAVRVALEALADVATGTASGVTSN
jgi:predicted ATPase/DNA-binding SARP family transcriptional activator